jgi:methionine salvage enolase-phosphatase E1
MTREEYVARFLSEGEEINEKKLDRDDMIKWIEKYMDFVRTTEEFNGSQGGIWVSGENMDEYKGRVIYDYYSEDYKNRTFGVDNKWEKELNKKGWYSEWHDAGTSMIWPL